MPYDINIDQMDLIDRKTEVPNSPPDEANVPTQDMSEIFFSQPDSQQTIECTETKIWGKLFPMMKSIAHQDLLKSHYTFGRAKDRDIVFDHTNIKLAYLNTISKQHFEIIREELIGSDGYKQFVTFLIDTSINGTYVNAELVGKSKKIRLNNDDVISLAEPNKMKIYMYMDEAGLECLDFPHEIVSQYAISRTLGSGASGEVKMAFCKKTMTKFAIKTICKKNFAFEDTEKILNEIKILKKLDHPCVIKMENYVNTSTKLFIVLELMEGGELLDRIRKKSKGLSEKHTKSLFYQVCLAVQYLHKKGIAHRDLKPENILLATSDDETLVKLTDFGLSKLISTSRMKTFCGTMMYVAPEVLKSNGLADYTKQVDMWSLGVILYCCLSGLTPFNSKSSIPLEKQILSGHFSFPPCFHKTTSNARNMIKRLMTLDPNARINVDQLMDHPWFLDRPMQITVDKIFSKFGVSENVCPIDDNIERELVTRVAKRARISSS